MNSVDNFLAWFLGPKAENAKILEDMMLLVLRDYAHWRRNYFPSDPILVTTKTQRLLEDDFDSLANRVSEMMAELRRNFPFYSPRYVAHQLSEVSLPSLIGSLAGMLYNPNNVTPEAAPVTVDWEIEACGNVLTMLGYDPPPPPPADEDIETYFRDLRHEFGWAHITSGGTIANIEALWVARNVRYFPLSVKDAATSADISLEVKSPDGNSRDIRTVDELELLFIKPNEGIYLLARFIDAIRQKNQLSLEEASDKAWNLLRRSNRSILHGTGKIFSSYPPVIFASGAAHYSIQKAADVLGIGRDGVEFVNTDSMFRMDVNDLEKKLLIARQQGRIPVAVIAIAGTTEEGAVDPIHKIVDLRTKLEKSMNMSFWIHTDAAWGGFIASLFRLEPKTETVEVVKKIATKIGVAFEGDLAKWSSALMAQLGSKPADTEAPADLTGKLSQTKQLLDNFIAADSYLPYLRQLEKLLLNSKSQLVANLAKVDFSLSLGDRIRILNDFVQEEILLHLRHYSKKITIQFGAEDVCSAFLAISKTESATVDPHKMGYGAYPCGVVCFKNDRVRHFIMQRAPYITAAKQNALLHMPPKHLKNSPAGLLPSRVVIESFGPFILEGSKPGSAAASLWLSTQTVPLNMMGHGSIVRASLIAARELYEWLIHWDKIVSYNGIESYYEFIPFTGYPPDTNLVIFAVRKKASKSLQILNSLTTRVYEKFAIQAEMGDNKYSYAQPFFLSRTSFEEPYYSYEALENFFDRADIRNARQEFKDRGVAVLRATVMNPYISPMRKAGIQDVMAQFVMELANAAQAVVEEVK